MKRMLLLVLLLVPSFASAQNFIRYYPPASAGGTWDGGAFASAAEGPTDCTNPAYSFTADTGAGVCLAAANQTRWQIGTSGGRGEAELNSTSAFMRFIDAASNVSIFTVADDNISWLVSDGDAFQLTTSALTYNTFQVLVEPAATGLVTLTSAGTRPTGRSIAAGTGISVANGDGVAGNPTVSGDSATQVSFTSGTGLPGATCTVGQTYLETDVPRSCECTATNTWTCSSQARTHATDCTALTDGLTNDLCWELDSERAFLCQPTAGGCDTAGEWIAQTIAAASISSGDVAFSQIAQASGASVLVGRGSAGGAGDFQEITLGSGLSMSGTALSASGAGIPLPSTKRTMICEQGDSSSTGMRCHGLSLIYITGPNAVVDPTADDGVMGEVRTPATTNATAIIGTNNDVMRVGRNGIFETYIKLDQTTNQRVFVGLTSSGSDTASTAGDDVTDYRAMFRASTSASDTNWQCVTNDNSGGGTINDSSTAISTTSVKLKIIDTGSSFTFYINGSLVCTNSTNLPTGNLYFFNVIRTLADEAKDLLVGYTYAEIDR